MTQYNEILVQTPIPTANATTSFPPQAQKVINDLQAQLQQMIAATKPPHYPPQSYQPPPSQPTQIPPPYHTRIWIFYEPEHGSCWMYIFKIFNYSQCFCNQGIRQHKVPFPSSIHNRIIFTRNPGEYNIKGNLVRIVPFHDLLFY